MSFESIEQQASYGIGLNIGQQLRDSGLTDLDAQALLSGLQDSMAGNAPRLEIEKIHNALETLYKRIETKNAEKFGQNAEQGMAFLAENQTKEGVNLTDSGLQFKVLNQGEGAIPKATDRVRVHYTGRLIDGTVFDSSEQRGTPAEFPVNGVIPGWVEALQLMPVGSKWQLYIPSEMAYGERGAGAAIPPHSALIFDVELLDIL